MVMERKRHRFREKGFTLLELLITILIMGLALVPMVDSFAVSVRSTHIAEETALLTHSARAKMDELLAMSFADIPLGKPVPLGDASGLTDKVSILGTGILREVSVVLHDGDGDGFVDADLKKITVQMKHVRLDTLKFNNI